MRLRDCLLLQHNPTCADWYIKEGKKYLQSHFTEKLHKTQILAQKTPDTYEECPIFLIL